MALSLGMSLILGNFQQMSSNSGWIRLKSYYLEIPFQFLSSPGFGKLVISSSAKYFSGYFWMMTEHTTAPTEEELHSRLHLCHVWSLCCGIKGSPLLPLPICSNLLEEYLPQLDSLVSWDSRSNWQSQASAESALCYGHNHSSCLGHLEY